MALANLDDVSSSHIKYPLRPKRYYDKIPRINVFSTRFCSEKRQALNIIASGSLLQYTMNSGESARPLAKGS